MFHSYLLACYQRRIVDIRQLFTVLILAENMIIMPAFGSLLAERQQRGRRDNVYSSGSLPQNPAAYLCFPYGLRTLYMHA